MSEKEKVEEEYICHKITLKVTVNLLFEMLIYRRKCFGIYPESCN